MGPGELARRDPSETSRGNRCNSGMYQRHGKIKRPESNCMRIAATGDLHFTPQGYTKLKDQFERVRDEADVLILAGDLTNYGQPAEIEPLLNVLVRLRLPTITVLGNHDYESGKNEDLCKMMTDAGIKVLDGSAYERDGAG